MVHSIASTNYYHLLGVEPEATHEEIRQAFYDICRRFHPDKKKGDFQASHLEHWSAMQTAWKCLSNETRRIIYDIRREGRDVSAEDCQRLLHLQREQAQRDIENMRLEYQRITDREKRKNGIVIQRALYGDLRVKPGSSGWASEGDDALVGPWVDVAMPLQCAVDSHKLILPGGVAKADLPGFYNPIPLIEERPCALYVLYDFKGLRHEVSISDNDALWLPLKGHALAADSKPQGPHVILPSEEQENRTTSKEIKERVPLNGRDKLNRAVIVFGGASVAACAVAAFWYAKRLKQTS